MAPNPKTPEIDCGYGYACQFCSVEAFCALDKPHHNRVLVERRLAAIDQIVLVLANKGGVGKSTVAANLATGLAGRGFRVGVADADVHGPNQSRFFGFAGTRVRIRDDGLTPPAFDHAGLPHPVRLGSLAFLLASDDTPVVWRDAYKHDFVHHLIGSFDWGPLDFLVVDMPPGTGNELITLTDMLEGSNVSALLVTTPQAVALMDSLKAARFCRERGLPLLGVAENMAGVVCPSCSDNFHVFPEAGFADALADAGLARLTRIPLARELAEASDAGVPVVAGRPESVVARAFAPLVEACGALGRADMAAAVAGGLPEVFRQNLDSEQLEAALAALDPATRAEVESELGRTLADERARLDGAGGRRGAGR